MKTFQSKSLLESRTVGLLKGLTLLFLGASVAVLATYGLSIDPAIGNATQYIQKIIVTSDGSASGAVAMILDGSGGNVGIGTGTPDASLHIWSPRGGTTQYLIRASMTNGADRFRVHDGGDAYIQGFLGIGASPLDHQDFSLYVVGSGRFSEALLANRFCDQSGANCVLPSQIMTGIADNAVTNSKIANNAVNGNKIANDAVSVGHLNGGISIESYEVPGTTDDGVFQGSNIYSDGNNVGIGTISPTDKFQIQSGGSTFTFGFDNSLSAPIFFLRSNASINSGLGIMQISGGNSYISNLDGDLILRAKNGPSNQMVIQSGGNVGIGTSTPSSKLQVIGALKVGADGVGIKIYNQSLAQWPSPSSCNDGAEGTLMYGYDDGGGEGFLAICARTSYSSYVRKRLDN